ncbi:MAG: type II toxin-antitoxin system PemK/MazF family toxin [Chitinophagaceae bacterium]
MQRYIIIIPFPFSDLSGSKRRPAFVIASLPGDDIILCQITSRVRKDKFSITLSFADFKAGTLPVESYIRPNRIFTADKKIILRRAASAKPNITTAVVNSIINIINN